MTRKYGDTYCDKDWLREGDYKSIAAGTGYSIESVSKQINGYRRIKPEIKACADKLVRQRKELVVEISK